MGGGSFDPAKKGGGRILYPKRVGGWSDPMAWFPCGSNWIQLDPVNLLVLVDPMDPTADLACGYNSFVVVENVTFLKDNFFIRPLSTYA